MGKFSDAVERRKKENHMSMERLPIRLSQKLTEKGAEPIPVQGFTTQNGFSPNLVAVSAPDSFDAENFKALGAQLRFPRKGGRRRSIMVTSALPGEGKSLVAANLGASIALGINDYVLLVDCDLRRPTLHKIFGCANAGGLHEYLTGKEQLEDLIIRSDIKKLSLLPAGSETSNPSQLFSSASMRHFLEEVKGRYQDRFIIIDAPPSQVTAETNILANYVDGIILVIMAQRSHRETIEMSIENLGRKKILGVFFNGYCKSHRRYQDYYKKYYK